MRIKSVGNIGKITKSMKVSGRAHLEAPNGLGYINKHEAGYGL